MNESRELIANLKHIDRQDLVERLKDVLTFATENIIDCEYKYDGEERIEISFGEFGVTTKKVTIPIGDINEEYFEIVKRVVKEIDRWEHE